MNKLHTFAMSALLAPAITLGASSALAQQSVNQGAKGGMGGSTPMQVNQQKNDAKQSDVRTVEDSQNPSMQLREYMDSVPAGGVKASNLMNTTVKTVRDEDIGTISDLIIDKNGQVVAIVVGVGGFLGMGERDVAIDWSHIMRSVVSDKQELRIDVTKENLQYAPEFK